MAPYTTLFLSGLIERLSQETPQKTAKEVEDAVNDILESMSSTLVEHDRIEIRGFGSFSLHYREPRLGRNPKTGEKVVLEGKYVPHFKPGKELRERVNFGKYF
jgi:integration host factor subunit beta